MYFLDDEEEFDDTPFETVVFPKARLIFNEARWSAPNIRYACNCAAHAFDEPEMNYPWLDSIYGTNGAQGGDELLETLSAHPAFTRIHKNGVNPAEKHIVALDAENAHILRFNNMSGVWSDKMGGCSARQWDDNGNALLDLDQAHWIDYKPTSLSYFIFNKCGFKITPWGHADRDSPDPNHYKKARDAYYKSKQEHFQLPIRTNA